jgi:pimeloyl-ACP methyl ester carboxylesterase
MAELEAMILETSPAGYAGCCEVLATAALLPDLWKISCPVRVIAGSNDPSTPPDRAREIAAAISQADLVTLSAAHISCIEAPVAFAHAVSEFVSRG